MTLQAACTPLSVLEALPQALSFYEPKLKFGINPILFKPYSSKSSTV